MTAIGRSKELGFNQSGSISQREKFHRLSRDLMMNPLLNDQPTRDNGLPGILPKPSHRAVTVPSHVRKQVKGMPTDRKTKRLRLPLQTLMPRRLLQRHRGQLLQSRRRQQPPLTGRPRLAPPIGAQKKLRLPKLRGSSLPKSIKHPNLNQ